MQRFTFLRVGQNSQPLRCKQAQITCKKNKDKLYKTGTNVSARSKTQALFEETVTLMYKINNHKHSLLRPFDGNLSPEAKIEMMS